MAMAAVQYPQAATISEAHSTLSHNGLPRYASPITLDAISESLSALSVHPGLYGSPHTVLESQESQTSYGGREAAVTAAKQPMSKIQKVPSSGSSKSDSRQRNKLGTCSAPSVSAESSEAPLPATKPTSSKSVAKDKFKSNLRKLAQQKRDDDQPILDLSQSVEENERRSGLGIYLRDQSSPSLSQIRVDSPLTLPSHSRNVSYTSQYSSSSIAHNLTSRQLSTPSPVLRSYSTPAIGGEEQYGESYISRYAPPESSSPNSTRAKPFSRVGTNTSIGSATRFTTVDSSQSVGPRNSISRSSLRPRRGTNQSIDTVSTPKSRKSLDRALSFLTRGSSSDKPEPIDAMTRAASIQAARQAFEEHETAKEEKYERQQQKAAEKASRREAGFYNQRSKGWSTQQRGGLRQRSRSRSTLRMSEKPGEARGVAYTSMPAGPTPSHGERALSGSQVAAKRSSRSGFKIRYIRFVSWLRTKFRMSKHRKRAS